jgi:hypothetical protein
MARKTCSSRYRRYDSRSVVACPYCDQRSTRRWNLNVHIKRKYGEYFLGRSSDRYMANKPVYSNSVQLVHATVADDIDNTFHPSFLPRQAICRQGVLTNKYLNRRTRPFATVLLSPPPSIRKGEPVNQPRTRCFLARAALSLSNSHLG